tara:strand:+ start:30094 stop:30711 length:618 start_codon:yes stop_codon:yes gene_type:complete
MLTTSFELIPGSDLLLSLDEIATKENSFGYVLSVVGNLSRSSFLCPDNEEPTIIEGNLEIITLNGTLSPEGCHLHLSVSDSSCKVWGGHLKIGSVVNKGASILLGFIQNDLPGSNKKKVFVQKSNERIKIYILNNCPWSKRAIRLLKGLNIPYKQIVVKGDEDFNLINNITKVNTFPQIFIDDIFVGGYDSLLMLNQSGDLNKYK